MSKSNSTPSCLICFSSFQSERCENPEYFTSVFEAFCRLMEVDLIEAMKWHFEQDDIPFCDFCYSAVERLKGLYDQFESLQLKINNILKATKQSIQKSQPSDNSTIINEFTVLDRVNYFRHLVTRGSSDVGNNSGSSAQVAAISIPTTSHPETIIKVDVDPHFISEDVATTTIEIPVMKVETGLIIDKDNNEGTTKTFLDRNNIPWSFESQSNKGDPLEVGSGCQYQNNFANEAIPYSAEVHVESDQELIFLDSDDQVSSVQTSCNKSDIVTVTDSDDDRDANGGHHSCLFCGNTFRNKKALNIHLKSCGSERSVHKCDICSENFITKYVLNRHVVQVHETSGARNETKKNHVCLLCGVRYSSQQRLMDHTRVHTGERPFKCTFPLCTKTFSSQSGLRKHKVYHTAEKRHICAHCNKCFSSPSMLQRHIKVIHEADNYPVEHNVVPGTEAIS